MLPDAQRAEFYRKSGKKIRDPDTYAALNWFFVIGLHHFYLRRWLRGWLNVGLIVISALAFLNGQLIFGLLCLSAVNNRAV